VHEITRFLAWNVDIHDTNPNLRPCARKHHSSHTFLLQNLDFEDGGEHILNYRKFEQVQKIAKLGEVWGYHICSLW
jgi:hypothetical protein